MMPLRVAVIADYLEEGWASMDLVAEMLLEHLRREHRDSILPTLVRPAMPRRLARLAMVGGDKASVIDRVVARQWDYPRALAGMNGRFDVYHIVDHSYAHLVHNLPPQRTLVTCHDIDAFRSILLPHEERRSTPYRWMARRILDGLKSAAHVACDSEATRLALTRLAKMSGDRLTVIPNGSDVRTVGESDAAADVEAARLVGFRGGVELLHVGTTVPRKRIDVLLGVLAAVRARRPDVRLIRVGGPLTAEQRVIARDLNVLDAVVVLPFVDRTTLAAVYRRAALALLPSEREGFGLPLVESLACGTPVIASDIPVLREVGGSAASYCPVGDVNAWRDRILELLTERETAAAAWRRRREAAMARSAEFSWSRYTQRVTDLYQKLAGDSVTGQVYRSTNPGTRTMERLDV
ncbi:MAG TPA: glycosyltransferase family 1 protein [Vicinamibacterales bacterium]|jgi:glycosyltransferase involved in cell wall biosynthesis